jgi:hypothetical protein
MTTSTVTPQDTRTSLLLREEIALLDVRHEAAFATGHPLFGCRGRMSRSSCTTAVKGWWQTQALSCQN